MALEQGIGSPRILDGGETGLQRASGFVNVRTAGVRDLVKNLLGLASQARSQQVLRKVCRAASTPIMKTYSAEAQRHEATGNLARAVTRVYREYESGGAMVVGPRQTGRVASSAERASANHAWLVEFGSGSRRPGTKGRRTYVNVHQAINGKMTRHSSANDEQFARMGKGYYFLMGSMDERAGAGGRRGYSRDFSDSYGKRKQHPIALKPGETIEPMPALGLMEKTINAQQASVFSILRASLDREITIRGGAA